MRKRRQAGQKCDSRRDIKPKFMVKTSKRHYFRFKKHRKSRRVSLIVAGDKQKLEKLVKHVPSRHQKPPLGGPQASKPWKTRRFRDAKQRKTTCFWFQNGHERSPGGGKMAQTDERCAFRRNIAQYKRPKRAKKDFLQPTKAALSS